MSILAKQKHRYVVILALIVALGGMVRLWGITFGLPHLYNPDEWASVMPALRILQTGDLNPHRFDYGSLYKYLLSGVYGLTFLYERSTGLVASIHDFPIYEPTHYTYAYDRPEIYLIGRALTAVLGTFTIVVVYLIGRRLLNRQVGLVAALFLAFFPLHVVSSHYITTDVPMTLLVMASFLFTLRVLERGAYRDYALAGLLAGLAASTKYTGGMIITVLVAAHFLRRRQGLEGAKLLTGLSAGVLGFAIGTPFALLDLKTWRDWLEYDRNAYNPPGLMLEGSSARWYLGYLLQSPSVLITLPGILGSFAALRDGNRGGWMATAFLAVYFGFMSTNKLRWPRALVPTLPFLALLAGFFVVKFATLVHRRWRLQIHPGWLIAGLTLLLGVWPLQASFGHAYRFTQKSARTLTREWVVHNLPPGTKIATDLGSPVLPPNDYQVSRVGWSILDRDLSWYQREGYEYLIITETSRYSINRTVEKEAQYQAFLSSEELIQVAEIKGHLLSHPDYRLWVYRFQSR